MDKRKPVCALLRVVGRKTQAKIRVYAAQEFPGHPDAVAGRYRLKLGRAWVRQPGKYTFFGLDGLGRALVDLLGFGSVKAPGPRPHISARTRVRVPNGAVLAGAALTEPTWTLAPPHLGYDGRWYVWCHLFDRGHVEIPAEDVEVLR